MTDERERRFRARINLNTGRAEVTEASPAMAPAQIRDPGRLEPTRTVVAPATAPLFPWARSMPTPSPSGDLPEQTDVESEQPWAGFDPELEGVAYPGGGEPMAGFHPASSEPGPVTAAVNAMLAQSNPSPSRPLQNRALRRHDSQRLWLPSEEPPAAPAVVECVFECHPTKYHPAGAFASAPPPRVYHPAGAFVSRDETASCCARAEREK